MGRQRGKKEDRHEDDWGGNDYSGLKTTRFIATISFCAGSWKESAPTVSGVASLFRRVAQRPGLSNSRSRYVTGMMVFTLKIIDDALGVVVYSCIAEHMNGGASSSTRGLESR